MIEMSFIEAIRHAIRDEMRADQDVFILGQDIGIHGGVFKATRGFLDEFGEKRVIDSPLSESGIVGAGIGAAMLGLRPIIEIQFADFIAISMDQLVNNAAKIRYLTDGRVSVPMVVRAAYGFGGAGAQHSQSPVSWLLGVPGIKIVIPSTPLEAYSLLRSSIRSNDPVVFLEHRKLYAKKEFVPEDKPITLPLGLADIKRKGKDLTLVSTGYMLHRSLSVAETVSKESGIDIEVIDLRTIHPLDEDSILSSVNKTSRLLIVDEAPPGGGIGSEVSALVSEKAFDYLDAPILRINAPDTPIPFSKFLLDHYVPSEGKITNAIYKLCS